MVRPFCIVCRITLPANSHFCYKCGLSLKQLNSEYLLADSTQSTLQNLPQIRKNSISTPYIPKDLESKYRSAQKAILSERKLVSIVFADLSGFTSLSEKLDAERVTEIINQCFKRLGKIVYAHEGYIDKFMGDCIMALFGAPIAHENDPELAIECSLKLLDELKAFSEEVGIELGMSIGINSGMVVAGGVGTDQKLEYTVMGDAVNIAQRLQSAAKRGQILVSANIRKICEQKFDFETLEPVKVKGKETPIDIFSVIGKKNSDLKDRGIQSGFSKLIGREKELQIIDRLLDETKKSQGQILLLSGDPGVGKSRLKHEIKKRANEHSIRWIESKCDSLNRETPYYAIIGLIQILYEIDSKEEISTQKEKLSRLHELGLEKTAESLIYDLLHLSSSSNEVLTLSAAQKKKALFVALKNLFISISKISPIALYIEDLHWLDPISKEFLDDFIEHSTQLPLMISGGSRPEFNSAWNGKKNFTHIHLSALSNEQTLLLAKSILQLEEIPKALETLIQSKADGNPLYIEEIIKSLIDSGKIFKTNDKWQISNDIQSVNVPPTLQGIIASRIDRLNEGDKLILQYASIIGRKFSDKILDRVTGLGSSLYESLKGLRKKELIFEMASDHEETTYIFNHALMQEVAYQSILLKTRKTYHEQVANALEERMPQNQDEATDDLLEALAHHFVEGAQDEKAVFYLTAVGKRLAQNFNNQGAIKAYQKALELIGSSKNKRDPRIFDLYFLTSEVYLLIGDYDSAESYSWNLLEFGNAKNDLPHLAKSFRRLGDIATKRGHLERALSLMLTSLDYSIHAEDIEGQIRTYKGIANIWQRLNNFEKSLDMFEKGINGAKSLGNPRLMAEYLNDRATVYIELQKLDLAQRDLESSIAIAKENSKFKSILISSTLNLGVVQYFSKDLKGALDKFKETALMAEQIGDLMNRIIAKHNIGEMLLEFGQPEEAYKEFEDSYKVAAQIGNDMERINNLMLMGHTKIKLGDINKGKEILCESIEEAQYRKFWSYFCNGLVYLSEFYIVTHDTTQAIQTLEAALKRGKELNNQSIILKCQSELKKLQNPDKIIQFPKRGT